MAEKKTVLSTVTKTLLKNVIRHTDTHNRIVEESEMWKQRGKELKQNRQENSFLKDRGMDMNDEFRSRSRCQAHMDEEPHGTYWMKQLYKAEEADSNRWGHSGYKQLYPEHFEESSSYSTDSEDNHHKNRHRKRKRHKDDKSLGDTLDRRKEKNERKRKHSSSETDTESQSKSGRKKSKKKHKHKHKKKKKKQKKEKRD